jgi:hypothetical protein
MVAVPLGATEYKREDARTAEISLVNCMIEDDPTNTVTGKTFIQRPCLTDFVNIGARQVRGVYRKHGVFDDVWIVVSDNNLYTIDPDTMVSTLAINGTITGDDRVKMVGSANRLIIVADGTASSFDGTTRTSIVMPNGEEVSDAEYINGYFILTCRDSQRWYYLAPGDTDPDALSFFSCETSADNLIGVKRLVDELWFFGQDSIEIWQITGDLDAPFALIPGRLYGKGCASRDTIQELDNTLFWVGADLIAYRADSTPQRISTHTIEERLKVAAAASTSTTGFDNIAAWSCVFNGHTLYIVTVGTEGTFVFDVENANWAHWKSYGQETWRAWVGAQADGDEILAGDSQSGKLWLLDNSRNTDDPGTFESNTLAVERKLTGGIPLIGRPQKCANVSLSTAVGRASITGDTNPLMMMRFSDDAGNLWSSWLEAQMGLQGKYRTQIVWQQLGQMKEPGRLFEFKLTDDAPFRVSYARMNDASFSS